MSENLAKVLFDGFSENGKVIVPIRVLVRKIDKVNPPKGTHLLKKLVEHRYIKPSGFTYFITQSGLDLRNSFYPSDSAGNTGRNNCG
jgi:hypothetical protein